MIGGARVHYVDEGSGPTLPLLHGNPTWSFLYREIIKELRGEFRCVAVDYPGFGMSVAPTGYGFTPAEHADVVADFVTQLDLSAVTLMVQDWGGPIGFAVATRHPDRFVRFVIGKTGRGATRARRRSHVCSVAQSAAISSMDDVAFREPERKRWEDLFADHRTVLLRGAGHFIQEDAAQEIVAAIREFVPR